jgi:hypothetical protein
VVSTLKEIPGGIKVMATKPVFVFVSAKTCPACVRFRGDAKASEWQKLKQMLEAENLANIVDIEMPTTTAQLDRSKYPADLMNYIHWFPTFILVSGGTWRMDPGMKLQAKVYNSTTNAQGRLEPSNAPMTAAAIMAWIRNEIKGSSIIPSTSIPMSSGNAPSAAVGRVVHVPTSGRICSMKIRAKNS